MLPRVHQHPLPTTQDPPTQMNLLTYAYHCEFMRLYAALISSSEASEPSPSNFRAACLSVILPSCCCYCYSCCLLICLCFYYACCYACWCQLLKMLLAPAADAAAALAAVAVPDRWCAYQKPASCLLTGTVLMLPRCWSCSS